MSNMSITTKEQDRVRGESLMLSRVRNNFHRITSLSILLLTLLVFCCQVVGDTEALVLVENGKTFCGIKADPCSPPAMYAADQLQTYFMTAANVKPEINTSKLMVCEIKLIIIIIIMSGDSKNSQAYSIHRIGNNIEIVGNSSASLVWAVSDFGEKVLNVMRPVPGEVRRKGKLQSTIKINDLDVTGAPDLEFRGWFHADNSTAKLDWMAQNRLNINGCFPDRYREIQNELVKRGISPSFNNHSFWWLIPASLYDSHPEYFPLIDGKRVKVENGLGPNFCVSNPEVAEVIISKAKEMFRDNTNMKVFPVVPNDDPRWCQCDQCAAWDGDQAGKGLYGNRLVRLANKVAESITDEFPDRYIGLLAYSNFIEPPTIKIAPNIAVGLCPMDLNQAKSITDVSDAKNRVACDQLRKWLTVSKYVYFWKYYGYVELKYCYPPIGSAIVDEYRDLVKMGVKGFISERATECDELLNLPAYVAARSGWDTKLSYEEILSDYCAYMYGPAAEVMKSYHLAYEKAVLSIEPEIRYPGNWQHVLTDFTPEVWKELDIYLSQGERIVKEQGEQIQIDTINKERILFEQMRSFSRDPRDIAGIGSNVLYNGDAEDGVTGEAWCTNVQKGGYVFAIDKEIAHSGKQSFRISGTGEKGYARWVQPDINVQKGKQYALSVWVRGSSGTILVWQGGPWAKEYVSWKGQGDNWKLVVIPKIVAVRDNMSVYLGTDVSVYAGETNDGETVYYDGVFLAELPEGK